MSKRKTTLAPIPSEIAEAMKAVENQIESAQRAMQRLWEIVHVHHLERKP